MEQELLKEIVKIRKGVGALGFFIIVIAFLTLIIAIKH